MSSFSEDNEPRRSMDALMIDEEDHYRGPAAKPNFPACAACCLVFSFFGAFLCVRGRMLLYIAYNSVIYAKSGAHIVNDDVGWELFPMLDKNLFWHHIHFFGWVMRFLHQYLKSVIVCIQAQNRNWIIFAHLIWKHTNIWQFRFRSKVVRALFTAFA